MSVSRLDPAMTMLSPILGGSRTRSISWNTQLRLWLGSQRSAITRVLLAGGIFGTYWIYGMIMEAGLIAQKTHLLAHIFWQNIHPCFLVICLSDFTSWLTLTRLPYTLNMIRGRKLDLEIWSCWTKSLTRDTPQLRTLGPWPPLGTLMAAELGP